MASCVTTHRLVSISNLVSSRCREDGKGLKWEYVIRLLIFDDCRLHFRNVPLLLQFNFGYAIICKITGFKLISLDRYFNMRGCFHILCSFNAHYI